VDIRGMQMQWGNTDVKRGYGRGKGRLVRFGIPSCGTRCGGRWWGWGLELEGKV